MVPDLLRGAAAFLSTGPGASLAIIVVSAWTLIALERRFPYDRGQRLFRAGWFNDFFLYTIAQSYVLGLCINALIRVVDARTGLTRLHLVSGWPLGVQMAFFFVVHDFYIYWFHRLQHRSAILWRIHEAHHSTEDVDWLSGSRSHALEILINQSVEFAPIVLLGAAPEVAVFKGTIDAVWGMYIHSNIDVRSGSLQYVINGPEMHRWHHSREFSGYGFNYATKLAIWDWIFGTAYRPATKPPGYGVAGGPGERPFPGNFVLQFLWAFRPFREPAAKDQPAR
jgi:sterol desaturase/sphingolipid hydroxylase (fatty acid hydroxylase superfamily)